MIHKSYLIEDNIDLLKNKFSLFYGENLGLKNEFKIKLKKKFKKKNNIISSRRNIKK